MADDLDPAAVERAARAEVDRRAAIPGERMYHGQAEAFASGAVFGAALAAAGESRRERPQCGCDLSGPLPPAVHLLDGHDAINAAARSCTCEGPSPCSDGPDMDCPRHGDGLAAARDGGLRHFAPYGSTSATCGETVPRRVSWDAPAGEYADARFTVRRVRVTCPECRWRLGLGPARGGERPSLPDPAGGCVCTWHSEDRGAGYSETVLEYDPACPEHSVHVYDPRSGMWVDRPAAPTVTAEQRLALARVFAAARSGAAHVSFYEAQGEGSPMWQQALAEADAGLVALGIEVREP